MDIDFLLLETEEKMSIAVKNYLLNLTKIVAGRANPKILDNIKINYFETLTPINQLSNINIPEARQILIKPYDMQLVKQITNVINSSSLGINAVDEGDKIRITLPEMTTDKRKQLVKSLSTLTENAKISIRAARQDANKKIKSTEEVTEDEEKNYLEDVQKLTDKFIAQIDAETKEKEKELMTI